MRLLQKCYKRNPMKHISRYYKRLHVRNIKIAVLAVFVSIFFLPVYVGFQHTGDNMFTVLLNGTEVGVVGSPAEAEQYALEARKQIARDSKELVLVESEIETIGNEVLFGQTDSKEEVVAHMAMVLADDVRQTMNRCYVVKINDIMINLSSKEEVLTVLQAALDKYNTDKQGSYVAELFLDPARELPVLTANAISNEEVQEHSESRQALESAPLEPDLVAGEEMQPETEKKTVDPSVELPASSSADSSVSSEVAAHHRRKNRHVWMWLLVTIVLMTMSYYAGYYRILCPCLWHCDNRVQLEDTVAGRSVPMVALVPAEKVNQKVNDTLETTEQVKPDSMPKADNPSKPVVSAQQIQRYPQVPGGKYLIVGQLAVHPMRVGDNLYKISRKYYGHYEGVKYINCLNNFTNPDVIQPGYKIKIPRLEKVQ